MTTNAQIHVEAAAQAYQPRPFHFPGLDCWLVDARAEGNTLVIESLIDGIADTWRYPNPPIMVPDPAGTESDGSRDDDENLITMRTDPLALQQVEYTKRVQFVRAERAG